MKSLLASFLLLTFLQSAGQTKQLTLSSDIWPPFTDVDSANAFAIDLVTEALARSGIRTNSDIREFNDVMETIRKGSSDGSAALWRSAEREKYLLYSEPYLENRLVLVGRKGSDVTAASLSSLKGKRVAIVGTYAYGFETVDLKNVTIVKGNSDQENLKDLLGGKTDYILVDALLIAYLLERQSKEASQYLEIGNNTMLTKSLHFAVRKEIPDAATIIEKFNREIKKMVAEGVYNKILNLNWIATDVDGDGRTELVLSGDEAGTEAPTAGYLVMAEQSQNKGGTNGYYIQGIHYSDWSKVPERYKIPPKIEPMTVKKGVGPVFEF